tara:strand:+ start:626 stop:1792 length:1167 start_codon:yes stop_codon:yes gene_type:complete
MIITTWNVLASGLADDKFITPTGDIETTCWAVRRSKILKALGELVSSGDVVGLQAVDSFFWLLKSLRKSFPNLHGILVLPNEYASSLDPGNEMSLLKANHNRTFGSEGCPIEFARLRCQLAGTKTDNPLSAKYHSPHGVALLWDSKKMSVTDYISPTNWQSLGQYEHMTYGYACNRHLTVATITNVSKKCLMINVAHLKSGALCEVDRSRHVRTILREMDGYSTTDAHVILMDSNYNVEQQTDHIFKLNGFLPVNKPHYNFTVSSAACILEAGSTDKVLVRATESLLWTIAPPPCSFWTPSTETSDILHQLAGDSTVVLTLKNLFELQTWQNSILEGVGTGIGGTDIDNAARALTLRSSQLVEALMSLQPNEYAPSDHAPVSIEFIYS